MSDLGGRSLEGTARWAPRIADGVVRWAPVLLAAALIVYPPPLRQRHARWPLRELTSVLLDLVARRGIATQTPAEWAERCHIVNLRVADAAKVQRELREKSIVVNVKDGWLRASMLFFNDEEDLERLVRALPG